ncbi:MAG: 2-dehydropantoate 2-reductase [Candidatus Latescibacterota bacterium]|jgi:2-dehydropantoate 2-reductase
MRVAVMGAGGLGGYFGGLLARGGAEVTLVARGPHLRAMEAAGLTVRSELSGDFIVRPPVTGDAGSLRPVDLLLFCVKAYDLEPAARQCLPAVNDRTVVVPVQNGIDAAERLAGVFGQRPVLGGLTYVASRIESPGVVVQQGRSGSLVFGELDNGPSARGREVLAFLEEHGVAGEFCPDVVRRLWEKFIVVCATGGVLAMRREPFGPVLASAEAREQMTRVMHEVAAVAAASGIPLGPGIVPELLAYLERQMAPEARSSQLSDLQAGRRLELEHLNGAAIRLGRRFGVPTPANQEIYDALRPYVDGARPAAG